MSGYCELEMKLCSPGCCGWQKISGFWWRNNKYQQVQNSSEVYLKEETPLTLKSPQDTNCSKLISEGNTYPLLWYSCVGISFWPQQEMAFDPERTLAVLLHSHFCDLALHQVPIPSWPPSPYLTGGFHHVSWAECWTLNGKRLSSDCGSENGSRGKSGGNLFHNNIKGLWFIKPVTIKQPQG